MDIAGEIRALDNQATQSRTISPTTNDEQNANTTAKNVASEVGLRQAQTATSLQTSTPAGLLVRDPTNPTAPPKLIPWSAMGGRRVRKARKRPGRNRQAGAQQRLPLNRPSILVFSVPKDKKLRRTKPTRRSRQRVRPLKDRKILRCIYSK